MAFIKNSKGKTSVIPSSFSIDQVTITNKIGEAVDVQSVVQEITIAESIYSPTMICTISVKDESNIVESLPFYGLETILIKLSRKQGKSGGVQKIERLFYVTEYPLFGRPRQEHTQVWSITGISYHAWKNPLMKISRYYSGPVIDQPIKIAMDFFGLKLIVEGAPLPFGKGLINIQSPLQAIEWFRRRLFEATGSPFYFFENLQNKPNEAYFMSHSVLSSKPIHERYYESRNFRFESGSAADYSARKQRMVDVSSELKLSKYIHIPNGTFAAENNFVDIAKRRFFKKYYDYGMFPKGDTIYGTSVLEPGSTFQFSKGSGGGGGVSPSPNPENIGTAFFSYMEHMSLNTEGYVGPEQNYNVWSHEKVHILNAFPGVFNTLAHDVTVFGDFELNAGKRVELFFPKAADPDSAGKGNLFDKNLSGEYIVMSAVHTFKDQEYYTQFRAKRDSFS